MRIPPLPLGAAGLNVRKTARMNSNELNWYALRVKSRHEFIASADLQQKGVETFLPSVVKMQQWKDRRKAVAFPLFPGYLFTRIPARADHFLRVARTRGSVSLVSLERGFPTPVPPEEITSLKIVVQSGRPIDIYPRFAEGSRIRVKSGPLQGAAGILVKKENTDTFVVNIEILGRSIGTKICGDDVEIV